MSKLRLYDYGASGNCYKVRLLLAQLGLEYERVPVDIFDGATLTEEYARVNPGRMVPVLETADGRRLPESNAILAYLAEGTAFMPGDRFERAEVLRWLIYEQTDVIPGIAGLRFRLLCGRLRPDDPAAVQRTQMGEAVLALLDDYLEGREFFVGGAYTIADIALYGYTHVAHEAGLDLRPHRNFGEWLARVQRQPGYIEDLEPYGANATPGAGSSIYD